MAQNGSPERGAIPPSAGTVSSPGSLPFGAQREVRFARYLTLLALPFVFLLYYDLAFLIGLPRHEYDFPELRAPSQLFVAAFGGLYAVLIYVLIYRRLTRSELSGALGATLVLGLLTLFLGLIPLGWGLGLGFRGLSSAVGALMLLLLVSGVVAGILLLLAYVIGARAERGLQGAASPSRA